MCIALTLSTVAGNIASILIALDQHALLYTERHFETLEKCTKTLCRHSMTWLGNHTRRTCSSEGLSQPFAICAVYAYLVTHSYDVCSLLCAPGATVSAA